MARDRDQSAELGRTLISQLRWALSVSGITSRDKIVLLALVLRADRFNADCWPSQSTIASDTGPSSQKRIKIDRQSGAGRIH